MGSEYLDRLTETLAWFAGVGLPAAALAVWACRRAPPALRHRLVRGLFLALLYVIASAVVLDAFLGQWGFRGDNPKFGFRALLTFEAERPFAYRVLSPLLVEGVARAIPPALLERHRRWLQESTPLLRYRRPGESWTLWKSVRWHVAYGYLLACLLGVLLTGRSLTRSMHPGCALASDVGPAVALLFLPLTFHLGGYLYDFPELLLLSICLLLAWRGRWVAFHLALALALLNKETGVFAIAYAAGMVGHRFPPRRTALLLGGQLVLAAAILGGIRLTLAENPGLSAWPMLPMNLLFWMDPRNYLRFIEPIAPLVPLPRGANVLTLALLAGLCSAGWSRSHAGLRRSFVFAAAGSIALLLAFGFLDEIRVLAPAFPPLYVLAWNGTRVLWSGHEAPYST